MPSSSSLARLNLRRNPFGSVRLRDWIQLVVADLEPLVEHLQQERSAIQFYGECGRGKSTHLRSLHSFFPNAPYIYIGEGEKPPIPLEPILFLDETQRIPWWRREWIFRNIRSIALATHQLHTSQLERLGYRVKTIEVGGLTLEKLETVVHKRLEWARREPGPVPTLSRESLQQLLEHFGDDLRGIERYLYEIYQHQQEIGDVRIGLEN